MPLDVLYIVAVWWAFLTGLSVDNLFSMLLFIFGLA